LAHKWHTIRYIMLSHLYRFHGHGSLRYLYRHGHVVRTPDLTVRYIKNPHRVHSRFAVIISKKVLKKATERNRLRRRIYEVIRTNELHKHTSYDVAISVFAANLLTLSHDELSKNVIDLFIKTEIIKKATPLK